MSGTLAHDLHLDQILTLWKKKKRSLVFCYDQGIGLEISLCKDSLMPEHISMKK